MPDYAYKISLQGATQNNRTSLNFTLNEIDFVTAAGVANQIRGALVAITGAFIRKETLSETLSEDNQLAPAGVDCQDRLRVSCHLNAPTELEKLHTLTIPAPVAGILDASGEEADLTNAALQQYVQQISQHALVSDGESIDTSTGTAGMKDSWMISSPKSYA